MIICAKHLKGTLHLTRRIHIFHQRHEPLVRSIVKPSSAPEGDLLPCQLQSVTTCDFHRHKQCVGRPSVPRAVPASRGHQSAPRPRTPHPRAPSTSSLMRQMGRRDSAPSAHRFSAPLGRALVVP